MRFWILEGAEASPLPLFPKEQEAAARLLAKTLNPDEVDKVYSLPAGRSRKLLHEDDRFRAKVIRFRRELDMFRVRQRDLAAGLGERQRRCAEMIASGRYTDLEIAGRLDITGRTIRNWKLQPLFALYLEDLSIAERRQQERVREESEALLVDRIRGLAHSTVDEAEAQLKQGNPKLALDVMKTVRGIVK